MVPIQISGSDEWMVVKKGGKRKGGRETIVTSGVGPVQADKGKSRSRSTSREGNRVRVPRTAAVSIVGNSPDYQYREELLKDRGIIPTPASLGIERTEIRNAATGGILIEVYGPDNKVKADLLATKLQDTMTGATISRPQKMSEMKLIGFDNIVSVEEVATEVSRGGNALLMMRRLARFIISRMGWGWYL